MSSTGYLATTQLIDFVVDSIKGRASYIIDPNTSNATYIGYLLFYKSILGFQNRNTHSYETKKKTFLVSFFISISINPKTKTSNQFLNIRNVNMSAS